MSICQKKTKKNNIRKCIKDLAAATAINKTSKKKDEGNCKNTRDISKQYNCDQFSTTVHYLNFAQKRVKEWREEMKRTLSTHPKYNTVFWNDTLFVHRDQVQIVDNKITAMAKSLFTTQCTQPLLDH